MRLSGERGTMDSSPAYFVLAILWLIAFPNVMSVAGYKDGWPLWGKVSLVAVPLALIALFVRARASGAGIGMGERALQKKEEGPREREPSSKEKTGS